MKLVYLCNEYPPAPTGGIGTFTKGLARELVARGHEVHVVGHYAQSLFSKEVDDGVLVWRLPAPSGVLAPVWRKISITKVLKEVSKTGLIDVIESPDFEGLLSFLPPVSRGTVVRLHGSHRYFSYERGLRPSRSIGFFEAQGLKRADAVVSVSDYTGKLTQQLFGIRDDISTIYNGVYIPSGIKSKSCYDTKKRAVYFGTLAEKKGVLPLAQAWRQFIIKNPDWTLTFIGRDSIYRNRSMKEQILEALGDASRSVNFVDGMSHENVLRRLTSYDFAVLPSFSESFGLVAIEAMALGVPVIFTALSSGPEIVNDGVDGWLSDPRDFRTITSAMNTAASSVEERKRVAKAAYYKCDALFSYEKFINKNIELYSNVCERNFKEP
ncbi:glycosyltransferase family 4 protein [Marinobacter qingdaonensis]|uniref:Glycosyltransferase family 4 protein n=1 Tax=Marinobacter qingdaonensis TaxID=3108486 RepID=A0ABU5P0C1_9GAMM|nr:glycosyltransferase family 4 protein [Marinobacter sp. ASW11-75]MEA1081432.1 glycosyltransferase family 4 protein [Marinobacter sp. ASW11-75]